MPISLCRSAAAFDVVHLRRQAHPPFGDHVVGIGLEHDDAFAAIAAGAQVVATLDKASICVASMPTPPPPGALMVSLDTL